jgi:hypothetical protein
MPLAKKDSAQPCFERWRKAAWANLPNAAAVQRNGGSAAALLRNAKGSPVCRCLCFRHAGWRGLSHELPRRSPEMARFGNRFARLKSGNCLMGAICAIAGFARLKP